MATVGVGLLLKEECDGRFSVILRYADGTEEQLPAITPAVSLITAVETDYSDYRQEIKRLRTEYPLLEERMDIPVADLEGFVAEALMLPSLLRESEAVFTSVSVKYEHGRFLQRLPLKW